MRVGFVIDSCVPSVYGVLKRKCHASTLLRGWQTDSAISEMRFHWVADAVHRNHSAMQYEPYRPGKRYDVVVFLKSMGVECLALAHHLKRKGVLLVFDMNVDYVTPAEGTFYYDGMAPSVQQRNDALAMLEVCDAVIGDSRHLALVLKKLCSCVRWVPDNVQDKLLVANVSWKPENDARLPLLWSGQATKMFELLAIEDLLLSYADRIFLRLVTNAKAVSEKIYEPYRSRLQKLLDRVPHEIISYTGISALMDVYDRGGVAISPRFLNNTYNLGHTEWKIALPMARGRISVCSPQMSYQDVAQRSNCVGIRVCDSLADWDHVFSMLVNDEVDWDTEQQAANRVVAKYYSTSKVAAGHVDFIQELL